MKKEMRQERGKNDVLTIIEGREWNSKGGERAVGVHGREL